MCACVCVLSLFACLLVDGYDDVMLVCVEVGKSLQAGLDVLTSVLVITETTNVPPVWEAGTYLGR